MALNKLVALLDKQQNPGVLCSSDGKGEVNAAVFGSVRLLDEQSIVVALGDNRTLENLRKNPKATYIFFNPGETLLTWQGARLYLEVSHFESNGPLFEKAVAETEAAAGKSAANMLKAAVVFNIATVRPLIDLTRRLSDYP